MLFRGQKIERAQIPEKIKVLLRDLVNQCATLEFHQTNDAGETTEIGKCKLFEYIEEENTLITDVPTCEGRALQVVVNEIGLIYFHRGGGLYRFESVITNRKVHRNGQGGWYSALCLSVPRSLESGNRRRHFRVTPLSRDMAKILWRPVPSDLSKKDDIPWMPAKLRDICGRGVSIWLNKRIWDRLRPNILLELVVDLPGDKPKVVAEAIVRRLIEDASRSDEGVVCLEFSLPADNPDACIDDIAKYVADCQREIARTNR